MTQANQPRKRRTRPTMSARALARRAKHGEAGEATVEFVALVVVVVLPALYLIVTVLTLIAASFATHAGVASATRIVMADPQALPAARSSVELALADQHLRGKTETQISCEQPCRAGAQITVTVKHYQSLPGLPQWLTRGLHLEVPITASQSALVYGRN